MYINQSKTDEFFNEIGVCFTIAALFFRLISSPCLQSTSPLPAILPTKSVRLSDTGVCRQQLTSYHERVSKCEKCRPNVIRSEEQDPIVPTESSITSMVLIMEHWYSSQHLLWTPPLGRPLGSNSLVVIFQVPSIEFSWNTPQIETTTGQSEGLGAISTN